MSYELLNFYQFCDNYKIPSYTDRLSVYQFCDNYKIPSYTDRVFGKAEIQSTTFVHF